MKNYKIISFVACTLMSATIMAQEPLAKSSFDHESLVALSGDKGDYYMNSELVSLDEMGRTQAQVMSFHESGNLLEIGTLIDDQRHGVWKKYSDTGKLLNQAYYVNGKKDGVWKVWDENGILRLEFKYELGKRVGQWNMYDEAGRLINSQQY